MTIRKKTGKIALSKKHQSAGFRYSLCSFGRLDQMFSDNANLPDVFIHGHNYMVLGQVLQTPLKHTTHNNNQDTYVKMIIYKK